MYTLETWNDLKFDYILESQRKNIMGFLIFYHEKPGIIMGFFSNKVLRTLNECNVFYIYLCVSQQVMSAMSSIYISMCKSTSNECNVFYIYLCVCQLMSAMSSIYIYVYVNK